MEILLWLVPSLVVTLAAMAWVAWLGREHRGEVDRDEALAMLARAMDKPSRRVRRIQHDPPERPRERSTGIAVRPSRTQPVADPPPARETRRAS